MNSIQRISKHCLRSYRPSIQLLNQRRLGALNGQTCILPTPKSFSTQNIPRRTIHIPPLPIALTVFGFGCLGLGLYQYFWSDIQKYPVPVRQALRKALYYENYGNDASLAIDYYRQALELALESEALENNSPHVTGILIQYGTLLEKEGRAREARDVLSNCIGYLLNMKPEDITSQIQNIELSNTELTGSDRLKILGIAQKLGDLSTELKDDKAAEKWYSWSVEQMFKSTVSKADGSGVEIDAKDKLFNAENMPKWLTHTDVGASMEALAAFYAERGNYEYALHLYLRTLSLYPALKETCHASVVMCNIAEAFAGMGQYQEAIKWAEDGIELAKNPNTGSKKEDDRKICDEALGVLLYNIGMIYEVRLKKYQENILTCVLIHLIAQTANWRSSRRHCILQSLP